MEAQSRAMVSSKDTFGVYLIRYPSEHDFGFGVEVSFPNFKIVNVVPYGPAWRAGIRNGSLARFYDLSTWSKTAKDKKRWTNDTINLINATPSQVAIMVCIQQPNGVQGIHHTRLNFIRKMKVCLYAL